MSSTFTAEDIPAHLREKFEALPPEMQQRMLSSMTRVRAQRIEAEARQKVEVPEPPEIDERDLVADQLFPSHGRYGSPLSPAQQRDVDAQLGYPDPDRQLDPRAHNQAVRMLTLAEAAEVLGVSTSTAFRMTRGGGLPAVRFFKTLRIRSDHAWAVRNRRAAGQALGKGWDMLPRQRGSAHHGVPIEEVAATLRVHPQTLWRWGRRYAAAADPDEPVTALPWRCAGRRNNAVIPEDVLASWGIPYDKSSLRLIRFTDVRRLTAEEKKLAAAVLRRTRKVVGPDEVRRTDKVRDAVSGLRLYTMVEASKVLALSVSGARKALAAAGIETQVLAGVARVRQDDLMHLLGVRSARVNRKLRPDFVPDYGPDPLLVPIEDAAVRMGVTVRTLRRRGAAGKIDLVTLSGKLWVRRHEVAAAEADVAQAQLAAAAEPVVEAPAASRGAALTSAHIETFTEWLAWRYPDIDTSSAVHTRASAALAAGCRPSVIESLVREGLIPAHRRGRDLQIRLVDLVAAGVFSAKVARMCPKLRPADAAARRNVTAEFLTFDQAARILDRPATEIRYLASIGTLSSVRFGNGAHRLHESEISGPARQRFNETARPYRPLKRVRHFGWGYTVNDAANHLGVSERTVLRMIDKGSLLAVAATKEKWRLNGRGFLNKMPVPVNHGGFLVSERSVLIARRLRQVRGELPRDDVRITVEHLRRGVAPELQAWQRFLLVDESGNRVDEYGNRVAV